MEGRNLTFRLTGVKWSEIELGLIIQRVLSLIAG